MYEWKLKSGHNRPRQSRFTIIKEDMMWIVYFLNGQIKYDISIYLYIYENKVYTMVVRIV